MRNVSSLTDYLLNPYYDEKIRELSEVDAANQTQSIISYRIENMVDAALCYTPVETTDGQYQLPEIDIEKMTSVGVAMAMLIMSAMQNEVMLDTQMEAVKGTQNQKLGASNTTILKIRQQYRKKHFKSAFQKVMEWLSDTWVMKFLNSNYGKVIMFLIGVATTIATFGAAGPAVIAIECLLMGCQVVELVMGKSMGELLTQSMDDGSAKMALQMSIDVGLMVADVVTGSVSGGKAATKALEKGAEIASVAGDVAQQAKNVSKQLKNVSDQLDKISDQLDNLNDLNKQIQELTETADQIADLSKNLSRGISEGTSTAADVLEQGQKIQKETQQLMDKMNNLKTALNNVKSAKPGNADLIGKIDNMTDSLKSVTDNVSDSMKTLTKKLDDYLSDPQVVESLDEGFEKTSKELKDKFKKVGETLDDKKKGLEKGLESLEEGSDQAREIQSKIDKVNDQIKNLENAKNGDSGALDKVIDYVKDTSNGMDSKLVDQLGDTQALQKKYVSYINRIDAGGSDELAQQVIDNAKTKIGDTINSLNEKTDDASTQLKKQLENMRDQFENGTASINDIQKQAKDQKLSDVTNSLDIRNFAKDSEIDVNFTGTSLSAKNRTATGGKRYFISAMSGVTSGARFLAGMKGLEHLNYFQQITLAMQKLQTRIQGVMQFYQALYSLALNEEEVRNIKISAQVDAIRTKSDAQQEFYQMMIDNQMSDIQSLLNYVKSSYERAAEAIKEYGETNLSIARNLVI